MSFCLKIINKYLLFYKIKLIFFLILIFIIGCGDKLDLSEFPISNNGQINISDTVYVLQSPVWSGFNGPEDIIIGNDQIVYIADTKNDRIVQMDVAGGIIGIFSIYKPRKLAQDGNLDMLVVSDSILANGDTINLISRIKLTDVGGLISDASKITLINSLYPTPNSSTQRKFRGITVFPDNAYNVTRTGPDDPLGIDPGNAIIKMKGRESVTSVTVLSGFQPSGSSFYSIENVRSITSLGNNNTDFIISRSSPDTLTLNKVIWFVYNVTNGTYDPKFTSSSIGLVSTIFGEPDDVTLDNNYSVYVIDSYRNFLFKYNNAGKYMKESFGGYGSADGQFINPKGVAFYNKVLYIADTGNNRIVRYKLSTDLN